MPAVKTYLGQPVNSSMQKPTQTYAAPRAQPHSSAFPFTNPFQEGSGFSNHRPIRNAPRPISCVPPGIADVLKSASIASPSHVSLPEQIEEFEYEPEPIDEREAVVEPEVHDELTPEPTSESEEEYDSASEYEEESLPDSEEESDEYTTRKSSGDTDRQIRTPRLSEAYGIPLYVCDSPTRCGSPRSIPCELHREDDEIFLHTNIQMAFLELQKQLENDSGIAMNASMKNPFNKPVETRNEWSEFNFLENDHDFLLDEEQGMEDEDEMRGVAAEETMYIAYRPE